MHIQGVETLEQRGSHTLVTGDGKGVEVQIAAVPASLITHIARTLPEPQPPVVTPFGKDGRPGVGVPQTNDPDYQVRSQDWVVDRAAAVAFHALRNEPGISWESGSPQDQATRETYLKIRKEMEAVGFSGEEIVRLAASARELATVTEDKLRRIAEDFPSAPGEAN